MQVYRLASIGFLLELEPQLQNALIKGAKKVEFTFPQTVHDTERDVFIWRAGGKLDDYRLVGRIRLRIRQEFKHGRFRLEFISDKI
jgi:hypothetical protein